MRNNMLDIFGNNVSHRYNIINILIVFFLSVAATYQIHYWTNGIVLSSPLLTFVIFSSLFVIFSIKIWPWMKVNAKYDRESGDWRWIIVSLLAVSLVVLVWIGTSDLPGDYGIHKHYVLKLLNGSAEGTPLYKGVPGYYPIVSHVIIAVVKNLSGLHVHHSYLFVEFLISFLIPLISYKLARYLGFSSVLSLFFSGLISLYGGFGQGLDLFSESGQMVGNLLFQRYLPAVQMYLPNISRDISLLLFLVFLCLCFNIKSSQRLSLNTSISIGILIGLIGLTHPATYCIAILFLFIHYGIAFRARCFQKEVMLHVAISVFMGIGLASLHYVPLFFKILQYGNLGGYMDIRNVLPSRYFLIYGPLPLFGLCAFLKKRKDMESWMLSSFLIIIAMILGNVLLGWVIDVDKIALGNFFLYKYTPYMFVFLALLATAGFENLYGIMKRMRFVVISIMILITSIGYLTALNLLVDHSRPVTFYYLEGHSEPQIYPEFFPEHTRKEVMEMFYNRGALVKFVWNLFPVNKGIEKLRFHVSDPDDTIMVPPSPPVLSYVVAAGSGLNVSYAKDHRVLFKDFFIKTISQEERLKMVNIFYDNLENGILREDVLSFFETNIFLSSYYDLQEKHVLLKEITSIKYKDKEYFLYRLDK